MWMTGDVAPLAILREMCQKVEVLLSFQKENNDSTISPAAKVLLIAHWRSENLLVKEKNKTDFQNKSDGLSLVSRFCLSLKFQAGITLLFQAGLATLASETVATTNRVSAGASRNEGHHHFVACRSLSFRDTIPVNTTVFQRIYPTNTVFLVLFSGKYERVNPSMPSNILQKTQAKTSKCRLCSLPSRSSRSTGLASRRDGYKWRELWGPL